MQYQQLLVFLSVFNLIETFVLTLKADSYLAPSP